jgi:hypothetical protein
MSFLHPHVVRINESSPTSHELLSDAFVRTVGSYNESLAIHERSEADYAALCCDGDEADVSRELATQADAAALEDDRQDNDEATAEQELWNVADRYGIERMYAVLNRVEQRRTDRSTTQFKAASDNFLNAMREALAVEPDRTPAA